MAFEGYDDDVIDYVTSPATGLQRTQKYAPLIPEIIAACDARIAAIKRQKDLDEWAEKKRKSAEIRARNKSLAPISQPNLFVPEDHRNYEKMSARLDAEPERGHAETRVCQDGIRRTGICIPLSWWEEPKGKAV